ncbi:MAG: urea ABC transporter permease subunit UrtB [Agarilytica sp.]
MAQDEIVKESLSAETHSESEIELLLQTLAKAKLSKSRKIVEEIEAVGGKPMLVLFETMLEGKLYYIKDSLRVISYKKNSQGEKEGADILTGESYGMLAKKQVKKIRVNNQLRKLLKNAIARNKLRYGSDEEKITAANKLLEKVDEQNVTALRNALEGEKNKKVANAINIALALSNLKTSDDREVRLAALSLLGGNLESTVRNEITYLAGTDADGEFNEPDRVIRKAAQKELKLIEGKINFYGFVENLFFGLSAGSVLLLAAIGLAITFGVMGVINMAHGEMIMLGAYTTYVIQLIMPNLIEYSIIVAIPAAFIVSGLVGMLIEYLVIRRLHGRPLETLLATFGISLILMQTVRTIFSPLNVPVSTPEWMSGLWEINPILALTYNRVYILIFSLIVFFALMFILNRTSLGLRVRAVSQNRAMAKSLGVKTEWVDSMTFGLGSGIAGVAGVALSQITNVGPNLGQAYIIDSFMVVVFGGVGNILGTLFGGFSLGIANKFLEPATGAVLAKILVLVFIILFIQRKPKGLFPQKGRAAE